MLDKNTQKQIALLPIYKHEKDIINAVKSSSVTIIMGETGSGKTTQTPKIIYNNFNLQDAQICVTQPRRVAAISIAERVSEELNSKLGNLVGFSVRFKEKTSQYTKIKFVTDGMLVRECIIDPLLKKYKFIILDEVHERSIHTDILLAVMKDLITKRDDLKIIIMSATMDPTKFMNYFNTPTRISIQGRTFPVKVYNVVKETASYIDMALSSVMQILLDKEMRNGDILVFLPGQEDIEDLASLLNSRKERAFQEHQVEYKVLGLFSALPYNEQMRIFLPSKKRKVILATNIAETSITIKNIKFIVDTGLFKKRKYMHKLGVDTLSITKISKASAVQRAGRAGRESDGCCFRLYTEAEFEKFVDSTEPEILRINLRNVILQLMSIGFTENISEIDFLDKPNKENYLLAYDELKSLKALNSNLKITELGKSMASLPVEPVYAVVLISSLSEEYIEVQSDIVALVSLLQSDNILYTPSQFKEKIEKKREKFLNPVSDHLTLLNIYHQYLESENKVAFCKEHYLNNKSLAKTKEIYDQLQGYLSKMKKQSSAEATKKYMQNAMEIYVDKIIENKGETFDSDDKREKLIIKCLLTGLFDNIARYSNDNIYVSIKGNAMCKLHPSSFLLKNRKAKKDRGFVLYSEMIVTTQRYLKCCTLVREEMVRKYINKNIN